MCYDAAMLGKIFLTLVVIVAAALYLRHRGRTRTSAGSSRQPPRTDNPWQDDTGIRKSADIPAENRAPFLRAATGKTVLWSALSAALVLGAGLYYLSWQEARRPVTVILHDGSGEPVIYEVRKRDLGERAFTTLDGTRVTVGDSERMEVIGL